VLVWLAADDYYDGEASGNGSPKSLQVQDTWLNQTLQPLFASPAWTSQRSLLILTWDESQTRGTNHIATILVDSQNLVNRGYRSSIDYNHYNVGRTIEFALGLAPLTPNDQYAQPINDAFQPIKSPASATLQASAPSVKTGSSITFAYSTPADTLSAKNWIGLYPVGVVPGAQASTSWQYVPNLTGSVAFGTSGLASGNYTAWYCYDDGYQVLAGPVSFSITP